MKDHYGVELNEGDYVNVPCRIIGGAFIPAWSPHGRSIESGIDPEYTMKAEQVFMTPALLRAMMTPSS